MGGEREEQLWKSAITNRNGTRRGVPRKELDFHVLGDCAVCPSLLQLTGMSGLLLPGRAWAERTSLP